MNFLNKFRLQDGRTVCIYQVFPGEAYYEEYFTLRTQTWCKDLGGVYAEGLTPGQSYECDNEDEKSSTLYAVAVDQDSNCVIGGFRLFWRDGDMEVSRFLIRPPEGSFQLPDTKRIVAALVASMQLLLPTYKSVVATINARFLKLIKRLGIGVVFETTGADVWYLGGEEELICFTPVRMSLPNQLRLVA